MIRATGKTVTIKPGRRLTKHDFLLPLSDILLDFVEKDIYGPSAAFSSQLGCSLAHDFVRLAEVAGQLLWLVDTAPVRTGTPDSISISILAESYLMYLRSACDVIAVIIHTFCIDEKKKGQVSVHGLVPAGMSEWAIFQLPEYPLANHQVSPEANGFCLSFDAIGIPLLRSMQGASLSGGPLPL